MMGIKNQQKRAAKAKQRQKRARAYEAMERRSDGDYSWSDAVSPVEQAFMVVEDALDTVDETATDELVSPFSEPVRTVEKLRRRAGFARHVDQAFRDIMHEQLRQVWLRGWQAADIVWTLRQHGATAMILAVAADSIAAEIAALPAATVDERFPDQLAGLGASPDGWPAADLVATVAERQESDSGVVVAGLLWLISRLPRLPDIPVFCPPPGQARPGRRASSSGDTRLLDRVRGLLAKAESTSHEAEAEALTAKAQELMTRHSIDQALLAADGHSVQEPGGIRLGISNPYSAEKFLLLDRVALANRCHAVWGSAMGFATLMGFPADLRATEILYTSLLMQATQAMLTAGSRPLGGGRNRTASFRRSFQRSFALRIGERLAATDSATVRDQANNERLLPVLAGRAHEVREFSNQHFPDLTMRHLPSTYDGEGWALGRHAADLAPLTDLPSVGS